jgi:hypothetical protein
MGCLLLGSLFLADWYFPTLPAAAVYNDIDRSVIRINSSHKWPEAIRFDTSAPVATVAPVVANISVVGEPRTSV